MMRPGSKEQRPTLAPTLPADSEAVRRLLVPVPDPETALPALTRRVWQLAEEMGVRVTFFALCHDPAQESSLRRRLVMMAAMASSGRVRAEAEVIFGRDWAEAVRSRLQPGDMLICLDDQRGRYLHKPLSQVVQASLDVPIHILFGLTSGTEGRPSRLGQMTAWAGSILIILGFLVMQVRIGPLAGSLSEPLQLLSLGAEAWLLWAWNRLLG